MEALKMNENIASVKADSPNIFTIIRWGLAYDSHVRRTISLLTSFDNGYLQFEGTFAQRQHLLEQASQAAMRANSDEGQANTLQALGDVHLRKNEYEAAVERYGAALPVYETIGARLGQANTLKALGDVHLRKNEYEAAVERYGAALKLGGEIGDFVAQLNSLKGLAFTAHAQNDSLTACDYARQLLTLAGSHPFFKDHPIVSGWRETFTSWGCEMP